MRGLDLIEAHTVLLELVLFNLGHGWIVLDPSLHNGQNQDALF